MEIMHCILANRTLIAARLCIGIHNQASAASFKSTLQMEDDDDVPSSDGRLNEHVRTAIIIIMKTDLIFEF